MSLPVKASLFLAGSLVLVIVSRESLKAPRSHGFYRFFAWECILALFLLNMEHWFRDPFSPGQLVSWAFLLASAALVVHAVSLLQHAGGPDPNRQDLPLFEVEKTSRLVTEGAYRYIRHPMYSSLLLLAWGIFLKNPRPATGALALAASGFLLATAKADERESRRYFGPAYDAYMEQTKRFVPFLF